jgi:hypothetical protein
MLGLICWAVRIVASGGRRYYRTIKNMHVQGTVDLVMVRQRDGPSRGPEQVEQVEVAAMATGRGDGRLFSSRLRLTFAFLPLLVIAACGGSDVRDDAGRVIAEGPWSVFDLRPGDCIGDVSGLSGDVDEVPLTPCDDPHTQEVFAVVRHPDDAYPGAGAVATFADRACLTALDAELDLTIDDGVAFSYLLPTFEGWNKSGDRSIVCVLVFPQGSEMVGSFVAGTADTAGLTMTPGQS